VASFRSTLEDAIHSHVLLIVLDVADPQAPKQLAVVRQVLEEIGADSQPRILLLNKVDKFRAYPAEVQESMRSPEEWLEQEEEAMIVSATTGEGLEDLRHRVLAIMLGELKECTLTIAMGQGKAVDFIEKRLDILERRYDADAIVYRVRLGRRQAEQLASAPGLRIDGLLPSAAIRELFEPKAERAARRVPPHERFAGEMPDLPAGMRDES
jgi:GTP-binding protein HflX